MATTLIQQHNPILYKTINDEEDEDDNIALSNYITSYQVNNTCYTLTFIWLLCLFLNPILCTTLTMKKTCSLLETRTLGTIKTTKNKTSKNIQF
jgi:hypothetical protein